MGGWKEARRLIWIDRRRLFGGMVLMLVNRSAAMVPAAAMKWLVDDVAIRQRWDLLPVLSGAVAAAVLIEAVTSFGLWRVLGAAAHVTIARVRRQLGAHVMRLPVQVIDGTKTGNLAAHVMTDADRLRSLLGTGVVRFGGSVLTGIGSVAVLAYLNWRLAVMTALLVATFAATTSVWLQKMRRVFVERSKANAEVTGRLAEMFAGIRIVKAYAAEKHEERIFTKGVHAICRRFVVSTRGAAATAAVSTGVLGAISIVVIVFGGTAVEKGQMSVGDLVTYVLFAGLLAAPIVEVSTTGFELMEGVASLDRIHELRSVAPEETTSRRATPLARCDGDVRMEQVTFAYSPNVPVLKAVSFHAPPRSFTALVGPSGSGKSTMIGLLMGLHRPDSGGILIDGRNLNALSLREYRKHTAVVLQQNFLFDGTVAENIAYSNRDASRAEIIAAAAIARCIDFVESLEHGFETVVGERGVRLSAGQAQRLAIARAVLSDAPIMLLDEVTSNLDSESEALVQEAVSSLLRGRTTIAVAHRLTSIRNADQILVLDRGAIVERGSHEALLALNGRYASLYRRQDSALDRHVPRSRSRVRIGRTEAMRSATSWERG